MSNRNLTARRAAVHGAISVAAMTVGFALVLAYGPAVWDSLVELLRAMSSAVWSVLHAFAIGTHTPSGSSSTGYSSTFSPAGEGCWIETTTYGPEKICGDIARHMVST